MTDSNFSAVRRIAETMQSTAVHAATGGVVAALASVVVFRACAAPHCPRRGAAHRRTGLPRAVLGVRARAPPPAATRGPPPASPPADLTTAPVPPPAGAQSLRMLCIGAGIGFGAGREWKTVSKDLEAAPLPPAVATARDKISGAIPERVSTGATSMWHQLRDRAKSAAGTAQPPASEEAAPKDEGGDDSGRGEDPE